MLKPDALSRLAAIILTAGLACACNPAQDPEPADAAPQVKAEPPPALPQPVLGRSELLAALGQAAADYATGAAPTPGQLAGRRFLLRQAFGCAGPSPAIDGLAGWSWGEARRSLELRMVPADAAAMPVLGGEGPGTEGAEGFWIARPWSPSGDCPAAPGAAPGSPSAPAEPQTVGLIALLDDSGSRLGRRNGRAYAHTVRPQPGQTEPQTSGTFVVVLEGRITAFADGASVRCWSPGPNTRPVCVAATRIDHVAFEDANGAMLSEWRVN